MATEKIFRPPLSRPSYVAPITGFALWTRMTGNYVPVRWPQPNRPMPFRPRINVPGQAVPAVPPDVLTPY